MTISPHHNRALAVAKSCCNTIRTASLVEKNKYGPIFPRLLAARRPSRGTPTGTGCSFCTPIRINLPNWERPDKNPHLPEESVSSLGCTSLGLTTDRFNATTTTTGILRRDTTIISAQFRAASVLASLSSSAWSWLRLLVDTGHVSAPQSFCRMNRNVLQLAFGMGGGQGREGGRDGGCHRVVAAMWVSDGGCVTGGMRHRSPFHDRKNGNMNVDEVR